MKKIIKNTTTFVTALCSPTAFSHTGVHTELYHPLSGVDHFLVILAIGVISGIAFYYHKK